MYIHHAIYDLVFKYVGTIEASEVSLIAELQLQYCIKKKNQNHNYCLSID